MGKLIAIKHQVDGTQLLIYCYILLHFHHSKMITLLVLLLQRIRQKNVLKCIQIVVSLCILFTFSC